MNLSALTAIGDVLKDLRIELNGRVNEVEGSLRGSLDALYDTVGAQQEALANSLEELKGLINTEARDVENDLTERLKGAIAQVCRRIELLDATINASEESYTGLQSDLQDLRNSLSESSAELAQNLAASEKELGEATENLGKDLAAHNDSLTGLMEDNLVALEEQEKRIGSIVKTLTGQAVILAELQEKADAHFRQFLQWYQKQDTRADRNRDFSAALKTTVVSGLEQATDALELLRSEFTAKTASLFEQHGVLARDTENRFEALAGRLSDAEQVIEDERTARVDADDRVTSFGVSVDRLQECLDETRTSILKRVTQVQEEYGEQLASIRVSLKAGSERADGLEEDVQEVIANLSATSDRIDKLDDVIDQDKLDLRAADDRLDTKIALQREEITGELVERDERIEKIVLNVEDLREQHRETMEQEREHTLTVIADNHKRWEDCRPHVKDLGYSQGSVVIHRYGIWQAAVDTNEIPGQGSDWKLIFNGIFDVQMHVQNARQGTIEMRIELTSGDKLAFPFSLPIPKYLKTWQKNVDYRFHDSVMDNGHRWLAKVDHPKGQPSKSPEEWALFGMRGPRGPRGHPGEQGIPGETPSIDKFLEHWIQFLEEDGGTPLKSYRGIWEYQKQAERGDLFAFGPNLYLCMEGHVCELPPDSPTQGTQRWIPLLMQTSSGGGSAGAEEFIELTDTPADYNGQANQFLRVNAGEDGLEFVDPPTGVDTFVGLTDTPGNYEAGKLVKVNPTGDGLIYGDPSGTTVSWGDISGTLANQTDLQNALDAKSDDGHTHPLAEITDAGSMAAEDDAASDGTPYGRQDGAWSQVATTVQGALADTAVQPGDDAGALGSNPGPATPDGHVLTADGLGGADWEAPYGGDGTDLGNTPGVSTVEVTSSTGANTTLPAATGAAAGVLASGDKNTYDNHVAAVTGNPHAVSKGDVGLGNVDNTSDADKPVSTAQQAALDNKSDDGHTHTGQEVFVAPFTLGNAVSMDSAGRLVDAGTPPGGSGQTDLGNNQTATNVEITSSSGANTTVPGASATLAGFLVAADKVKLDGIDAGAQACTFENLDAAGDVGTGVAQVAQGNHDHAGVYVEPGDDASDLGSTTGPNTPTGEVLTADGAGDATWQAIPPTNLGNTPAAGTVQITSSTGNDTTIPAATTTLAGVMSAANWNKLDGIEDGAQTCTFENLDAAGDVGTGAAQVAQGNHDHAGVYVEPGDDASVLGSTTGPNTPAGEVLTANGAGDATWQAIPPTDLGNTPAASTVQITSSTGNNTTIPAATTTDAGVMSAANWNKLDGIEAGAQQATFENLNAAGDVGTGADQVAQGNHAHAGVYVEPGDDAAGLGSQSGAVGQVLTAGAANSVSWEDAPGGGGWQDGTVVTDWGLTEAAEGGGGAAWTWDLDNGHVSQITLTQDATITLSSTAGQTNTEAKLILTTGGFTPTFAWGGMTIYAPDGGHDWSTGGVYLVNITKVGANVFVVEQLMQAA